MLEFIPASALPDINTEEELPQELKPMTPTVQSNLASFVLSKFEEARRAKEPIEKRLIDCLERYQSKYSKEKLAELKQIDAPEVYIPLTSIKCRALTAWLVDILFSSDELPYDIQPTPIPEIPLEIQTVIAEKVTKAIAPIAEFLPLEDLHSFIFDAKTLAEKELKAEIEKYSNKLAEGFKKKLDDVLIEGGFHEALSSLCVDIAIYPTAIIKGGILTKEKGYIRTSYGLEPKDKEVYKFKTVSPFNIYPSPYSTDFSDYVIEVLQLLPQDLYKLRELPGYNADVIDDVLQRYENGYRFHHLNYRMTVDELEGNENVFTDDYPYIDVLEFWGAVRGRLLREYGIRVNDPDRYYEATVWVIENHVLKAVLNEDPLGLKPYAKASFITVPYSFWGIALPEVLSPIQDSVNAMARAIVVNSVLSSGPIIERNIDRISRSDPKVLIPWHMYDVHESAINNAPAYRFNYPQLTADRLVVTMSYYLKMADETCGIPAYAHGDVTVGGAGRCLAKYTNVVTIDGLKPIKDLKEGDLVATVDGTFTRVIGFYPQPEPEELYRIHFSDGSTVDCTEDHLWVVLNEKGKKLVKTVKELLEEGITREVNCKGAKTGKKVIYRWRLPKVKAIQFPYRGIKVDPYTMGYYIGNGSLHKGYVRLHVPDEYLEDVLGRIPYRTNKPVKGKHSGASVAVGVPTIGTFIKEYGLDKVKADSKFIPKEYLYNSTEVRLEVLRGLVDSDGYVDKGGSVCFTTTSRQLVEDLRFLVKSLGGRVYKISEIEEQEKEFPDGKVYRTRKAYKMYFRVPTERISYISKKQGRYTRRDIAFVYIQKIEKLSIKEEVFCIKVEHKSAVFLCEDCIPTHNTATGLSMLVNNATRGIKTVLRNIDSGIIEPIVSRMYYTLVTKAKLTDIPDLKIRTKGTIALAEREMEANRALELLRIISNPLDQQLTGLEGRKYLLTSIAKSIGIDPDKIFGYSDELQELLKPIMEQTQAQMAQTQSPLNSVQNEAVQMGLDTSKFVTENGR